MRLYTAEDLPHVDGDYELVRGSLVEMTRPGGRHGLLCARVVGRLLAWCETTGGGAVLCNDHGFVLERDPDTVRGPGVAWLRPERAAELPERGYLDGGPDLAVEVLSPDDRPRAVHAKIADYLAAGSRMVWVLDPRHRTVEVYTPEGPPQVLRQGQALEGGDVLPGFTWPVAEVFP